MFDATGERDWWAEPGGAEAGAEPQDHTPRDAYVFVCPTCGRTPQIREEIWWLGVDEVARAGAPEIDISLLPF